jgi:hypothetical protein
MPSIKEKPEKSKSIVRYLQNTWLFVGISAVLTMIAIFGSFSLVSLFKSQNAIGVQVAEVAFETNLSTKAGAYVGAKTGKSYYFPWCGTVNRIKDANLVWFSNRVDAEALGYVPSSNCHGLK